MDNGGGDVTFTFTDQVSMLLYYAQLEEDLDRFAGSAKIGEDYITGTTLMLKPVSGLDLHLLGIYSHGQGPFGSSLTGGGGPFNGIAQDARNVSTESRYYLGFDSRYRMGNTSIEPGFVYLLGTREFTAASAAATGSNETDFNAFHAFVKVQHNMGPWLLAARFAYVSGDEADADINNRGIGNKSDVKGFRFLGVDSSHYLGEWFELLGKSDVDGTGQRSFRRMGEIANLEGFGWMIIGGHVEYKKTDKLTLTGSAGGFWTAEDTGCRSNFRTGLTPETCAGPNSPTNSSGERALNFTGGSSFVGWEVNAGLRYTIMPGLTWTPLLSYADYGDALETNNRSAKDAWAFVNRMIYVF
jgi:hypothetical protein